MKLSSYIIKFFCIFKLPLTSILLQLISHRNHQLIDFWSVKRRILLKNENTVYHLQMPALAPDIFKFEKCVKYANEMMTVVDGSDDSFVKKTFLEIS